MRTTLRMGLLVLAPAVLAAGCGQPAGVPTGAPTPPTRGTDVDGATFTLADYKGKVVLLDFWGNW